MAEIVDVHGERYRMETWYAEAQTSQENEEMQQKAFRFPPDEQETTIKVKRVLIHASTGELATEPIDVGTYFYLPSPEGFVYVSKVVEADQKMLLPDKEHDARTDRQG